MNDYISREAATNKIEQQLDYFQMVNWKENPTVPVKVAALNWCLNTIREIPAADVRRGVHGKWVYCENTFGQDGWVCELCHYFVPWDYKERLSVAEEKLFHFCPNCGAQNVLTI